MLLERRGAFVVLRLATYTEKGRNDQLISARLSTRENQERTEPNQFRVLRVMARESRPGRSHLAKDLDSKVRTSSVAQCSVPRFTLNNAVWCQGLSSFPWRYVLYDVHVHF